MATFLTQCPFCQTTFKVSDEQMQAASGVVRCGACMEIFAAGQNRITRKEKLPGASSSAVSSTTAPEPYSPAHQEDSDEDIISSFDSHFPDSEDTDELTEEESQAASVEETKPLASWDSLDEIEEDDPEEIEEPEEAEENDEADLENLEEAEQDPESAEAVEEAEPGIDAETAELTEASKIEAQDSAEEHTFPPRAENPRGSRPAFTVNLNPFAYSVKKTSADCTLPPTFEEPENDSITAAEDSEEILENSDSVAAEEEVTLDEDVLQDEAQDLEESDNEQEEDTEELNAAGQAELTDDESEPDLDEETADEADETGITEETEEKPAPGPADENQIPTLSPDMVAMESLPVSSENRTLSWLQSFHSSAQSPSEQSGDSPDTEEKAFIHSNLSTLMDEDSLAPLAKENLDAIDDEPVQLFKLFDPLKTMKKGGLVTACIVMLAGLAGQYLWFNLADLRQDERLAPLTSRLCELADCPESTLIDLSALITEELVIRSHPEQADALQVDFIFRNDAAREQLFPLVELNFTNNNGTVVANRVFTPDEYLPEQMHLFTHMPAHSSIQISLELVDPGDDASGYSLVFRNP